MTCCEGLCMIEGSGEAGGFLGNRLRRTVGCMHACMRAASPILARLANWNGM